MSESQDDFTGNIERFRRGVHATSCAVGFRVIEDVLMFRTRRIAKLVADLAKK